MLTKSQIIILTILSLILFAISCLCLSIGLMPEDTVETEAWPPMTMTIENWAVLDQGIIVEITMTNVANSAQTVGSNVFYLVDNQGRRYGYDPVLSAEVNNNIAGVGGLLAPGESIRGKIVFPKAPNPQALDLLYEYGSVYKIRLPLTQNK